MTTRQHFRIDAGIAIGPILFVIAILAILAGAIAAGSGSFTDNTTTESASTQASAILQQADMMKQAVQLVYTNGCADTQISFENSLISGYTNSNAPSDHSCHVFHPNGGGAIFPEITASTLETLDGGHFVINGNAELQGLGCSNNAPGACNKIIAFLPIDSASLCLAINTLLGGTASTYAGLGYYTIPTDHNGRWQGWYGSNNINVISGGTWPNPPPLAGCVAIQPTGRQPYEGPLNAPYFFYSVLLVTR